MAKIAVVLATYNGAQYLPQMLDSLVSQERRADIVIAVDDGSTDSTPTILRDYAEKLPLRIEILPKNTGHRAAFSAALEIARNTLDKDDLVALADQDDTWLPQKLSILEREMQSGEKALRSSSGMQPSSTPTGKRFLIPGAPRHTSRRNPLQDAHRRDQQRHRLPFPVPCFPSRQNFTHPARSRRARLLGGHHCRKERRHQGHRHAGHPVQASWGNAVGLGNRYTFDETCRRQIA